MRCTDPRVAAAAVLAATLGLAACSPPARRDAPPASPRPAEPAPAGVDAPAAPPVPATAPAVSAAPVALPRPQPNRDLAALKRQAADRILAANPTLAHRGAVREPLLAIPVLEVELERDGSVRRISVLRHPRQARDTTDLAIAAVRRAAPFGDVSALRRPVVFAETFLFGDDRRFKVRTHDE